MEAGRRRTRQRVVQFRRFDLTPEKFTWLWGELTKLADRTLADDVTGPDQLWRTFESPGSIHLEAVEDGKVVGYAMWNYITDWSASAHVTYFDRRIRGRETATRECIRFFMREMGWLVVHVYLPETHLASIAWVKRMGFRLDGRIRRALRRRGKALDYVVLSITREEIEEGGDERPRTTEHSVEPEPAADAVAAELGGVSGARPVSAEPDAAGSRLLRRVQAARWRRETLPGNDALGWRGAVSRPAAH